MVRERYPDKRERREMFKTAQSVSVLLRETRAHTRPQGQHAHKGIETYTPTQAKLREKHFLEVLRHRAPALPLVALELVEDTVEKQYRDNLQIIEAPTVGTVEEVDLAAGALTFIATGLDRFARTSFGGRELYASPDENLQVVRARFMISRIALEDSAAYRRATAPIIQDPTLFDTIDTVDQRE